MATSPDTGQDRRAEEEQLKERVYAVTEMIDTKLDEIRNLLERLREDPDGE